MFSSKIPEVYSSRDICLNPYKYRILLYSGNKQFCGTILSENNQYELKKVYKTERGFFRGAAAMIRKLERLKNA